MTDSITSNAAQRRRIKSDLSISLGLTAVVLFFLASAFISYWNTRILIEDSQQISHTHTVISALDNLLSIIKDAETGQRGFILTGDEKYLQPYSSAVTHMDEHLGDIQNLLQDDPEQLTRLTSLKSDIHGKMAELEETILLRRSKGFESALAVVVTDLGKNIMDAIRSEIGAMQQREVQIRTQHLNEMESAYRITIVSDVLTGLLGMLLSGTVAFLVRRSNTARRRSEWLQTGEAGLGRAVLGEQRLEELGSNIIGFLAEYLDAHAGAFFVKDGDAYRRVATYGIPAGSKTPTRFEMGDGLLGQAARENRTFVVRDVPEGYLTVGSGLGRGNPRHLVISAAAIDNIVIAVFELGFIHPLDEAVTELLQRAAESVAIAVQSANYRNNLRNFLEETQRQAEELQAQGEELRVANEELEEQSRMLKESQIHLEQQQSELEETNAQLEEHAQLLEDQRNDLARAKAVVQLKAQELEQASRYKSDFLANMSHELRTPLNSSLILAKLLADNPAGNLSEEQVKFAQTIQSSGNDLLVLINDILDLSKIEAGHMEIRPEPVPLERLAKDLGRVFEPVANQKGLIFKGTIAPNMPEIIHTDRLRLEQVLKNLLSNAMKFTEKGKVELTIGRSADGRIAFAVADTGIGIAAEQQQTIFDAFRQADGTISRKYGGTGLGLSISRELTRLLAGTIDLKSEPGQGSTFTVTLPENYDAGLVAERTPRLKSNVESEIKIEHDDIFSTLAPAKSRTRILLPTRVADDRDKLSKESRTILVVEDDQSFSQILYDLAHELDFQCLIATNAEDALAMCREYRPSAVVLDIGLPDHSGLSVLDRLKRDRKTRHIPVHVVSAGDYAQTAYSLGAVGYLLKPVKREELAGALKQLESKLAQQMRRVLIVEDDAVQRDSMQKLLGSHDVETIAVGTAAECLDQLKGSTFDCMVLDLTLPDASGYSLLETLSQEDAYSFPPVIVYTGRELSSDEEDRLRKYSKSIIIKGAKSPERLLDEVTLFLHKVVADLPPEQQKMLEKIQNRDGTLERRRILVVEDDVRNVYAITSIFEPLGAFVQIARNGREALQALEKSAADPEKTIDLVLMDVMMPEMDGLTATREIRKKPEWKKLPVIMLTAKAMKDDQEKCLEAGANDYMSKPLDVEKLLSLVRVWMPR